MTLTYHGVVCDFRFERSEVKSQGRCTRVGVGSERASGAYPYFYLNLA